MKTLIVGAGLAGSTLAIALHKKGEYVVLADGDFQPTPSGIAAGIVNPVTGKRYVKSWRLHEFLPFARQFYREAGELLGIKLWHEREIVRVLGSTMEANEWGARLGDAEYRECLGDCTNAGFWKPLLQSHVHIGVIRQAAQLDLGALRMATRRYFEANGQYRNTSIPWAEAPDLLSQFDRIVFCEGPTGKDNPWFPDQPWQLAKGEALHIRFVEPVAWPGHQMVKKHIMVAPIGNGVFWAGANYEWQFEHPNPTVEQRMWIENELRELFSVPFTVVNHVSAIRPTVKNRRPLILQSPLQPKFFLFNGLGAKGCLQAALLSQEF